MNTLAPLLDSFAVHVFSLLLLASTCVLRRNGGCRIIAKVHNGVEINASSLACEVSVVRRWNKTDALCRSSIEVRKAVRQQLNGVRILIQGIITVLMCVLQGQYDLVLSKEKPRFQAAFAKFATASRGKAYNPSLSIIVCGKRHNARFPATAVSPVTRNGNTVPGTVVDKGVTDIYDHDFYLQVCLLQMIYHYTC